MEISRGARRVVIADPSWRGAGGNAAPPQSDAPESHDGLGAQRVSTTVRATGVPLTCESVCKSKCLSKIGKAYLKAQKRVIY